MINEIHSDKGVYTNWDDYADTELQHLHPAARLAAWREYELSLAEYSLQPVRRVPRSLEYPPTPLSTKELTTIRERIRNLAEVSQCKEEDREPRHRLCKLLSFCGCVEEQKVGLYLHRLMELLGRLYPPPNDQESYDAAWWEIITFTHGTESYDYTVIYYLATQILDEADLIEHGTSIRGCWLTEKGRAVLRELGPSPLATEKDLKFYKKDNE